MFDNAGMDGHLNCLVDSPHLENLTHLQLAGWHRWGPGYRDCDALVSSASLNHLVELNLERAQLSGEQKARLRSRYGEVVRL